ncbi:MAG: inorganic phosphate transporter [Mycolicibacterium hassiacum]|uniref:inorganic phosphate transporter n=1 Tax=Mycolicibacterium hassiacum TaxID=46351 RepID=UPI0023F61B8D|nr:inorganic phosphate transporter [Mycolicibacterium hassiacum]MBX5487064.1 inorganic phosphate transporter [Mycolicibacterium hassiacum]
MSLELFLLIIVVITALGFDFTNGFHDTGNAVATSIASGALKPRVAVAMSAVLNLVGAFLSTAVAAAIAKGLIDSGLVTLELIFAGLVGGIVWNLLTWLFGLPSSSSHALIGGIVGATLAAVGGHGVIWSGVASKVLVPAVLAPLIAGLVATVGTWLVYRAVRGVPEQHTARGFRYGQVGSAALVSLAHGTNDAQKTMGVIFLALIAYGSASNTDPVPPFWVIAACAVAIALGTYLGGWRIIRTLGKGLVDIRPPQGMAAQSSSAAVILLSSYFGYSLSTTHVATGSILGSGVGKRGAEVRWRVAGQMAIAWLITLPAAGLVGAGTYAVVHLIGGFAGVALGFVLLIAASVAIWMQSRKAPINQNNVNAEWKGSLTAGTEAPARDADEPGAQALVDALLTDAAPEPGADPDTAPDTERGGAAHTAPPLTVPPVTVPESAAAVRVPEAV